MEKEKNNEGAVTVKFTVPSFRYKGVEYRSTEVEKAADKGDEAALAIVANLVKLGSGIVEVVSAEDADADKTPAPQAPKEPKAKPAKPTAKNLKAAKSPKTGAGEGGTNE